MDQVALSPRSDCLGRNAFPFLGASCKGFLVSGPIMQCRRVKVCSVGPYNRFHFRVDRDLVEQLWVKKRTIQFTSKNRFQVDHLLHVVCKLDAHCIRPDDLNGANLMNRMAHGAFLRERCDWQSLVAGLQPVPINHQFGLMQFSPCFY
jgi:hypothetical protein